jgi:hypothetical protein
MTNALGQLLQLASSKVRRGFPTLGTEWRGRSEAEVGTSEARKIRVQLARARGGASQEGLVSLLGAERMSCFPFHGNSVHRQTPNCPENDYTAK